MANRLPTPGGDNGDWGDILNSYLSVSLASDGTLNPGVVTNPKLDSSTQAAIANANNAVPTSQLGVASGVAQLDTNSTLKASQIPSSVVSVSSAYASGGLLEAPSDFAAEDSNVQSITEVTFPEADGKLGVWVSRNEESTGDYSTHLVAGYNLGHGTGSYEGARRAFRNRRADACHGPRAIPQ
jgi:hypothetical protein